MNLLSQLFSNLSRKNAPSDHPFDSDESVRTLIAGFDRSNPSRYLMAVTGWLKEIDRVEQDLGLLAAHRALVQLDHCGRNAIAELLERYLLASEGQAMGDAEWSALNNYAKELFSAYAAILRKLAPQAHSDTEKVQIVRGAAAAFRAWALHKKLLHFRYRRVAAETWKDAHDLLFLLVGHQLERILVVPYPGESAVTPLREYLIGLYAECLPAASLTPPQFETLDRFLRSCDSLEWSPELQEDSTHQIDFAAAAGPRLVREDDSGGASIRFCSTVKLHQGLVELADRLSTGLDVPHWLSAISLAEEMQEVALRTVARYWSVTPPHRSSGRQQESSELRVVIGFERVSQMVASSQRAPTQGVSVETLQQSEHTTDSVVVTRYGDVPVIENPTTSSFLIFDPEPIKQQKSVDPPMRVEIDRDPDSTEIWHEVDTSSSGLGATLPALLPRHRVGALIALRSSSRLGWRPAIIRRIGRDTANRPNIGVETLGAEPIYGQGNLIDGDRAWTDGADGTSGWSDVIVFKADRNEVLLPHDSFAAGKQIDIMTDEGSWPIRLHSLIERGADYDRATFVSADLPGK